VSDLNPVTWADGFGRWHASVPLTDSPLRDALAARRAILAELQARAPIGANIVIHVTRERVTNHGTVIYGEK
jgi:hypothetical protein